MGTRNLFYCSELCYSRSMSRSRSTASQDTPLFVQPRRLRTLKKSPFVPIYLTGGMGIICLEEAPWKTTAG